MELLSFSVEVLEEIMSYLVPEDLISLSLTCKKLKTVTERDQLWDQACLNEFGIQILASANGSSQRYYRNVLKRYGHMIGLWRKQSFQCYYDSTEDENESVRNFYGGLLQVTYLDGQITGFDLLPPKEPNFMEPLRPMKLFTISMDEAQNGKVIIKCFCSIAPLKHDDCELTLSDTKMSLKMKCSSTQPEIDIPTYLNQKVHQWLPEQADATNIETFRKSFLHFVKKFSVLASCAVNKVDMPYVKLNFPIASCDFPVPIQPGLFKGTYSSSGTQLVLLRYTDQHSVRGLKITGDQSCPAGCSTFQADLKSSIYLNEAAQASMDIIQQMNVAPSVSTWSELPTSQPFIFPQGCNDEHLVVPDQCRARFHGMGIVGCEGTRSASAGHWIVFNEDLFGFLWINSRNFSVFHRVTDPFLLRGQKKN